MFDQYRNTIRPFDFNIEQRAIADEFERQFINQGSENRSIDDSLTIAWNILSQLPKSELTRLSNDQIDKYYGAKMEEMWGAAGKGRV